MAEETLPLIRAFRTMRDAAVHLAEIVRLHEEASRTATAVFDRHGNEK